MSETKKICSKCGETKVLSEFWNAVKYKDGKQHACKDCGRAYYAQNAEREKLRSKRYRETHKEQITAQRKAYAEANRDELRAANRAYYKKNADTIRARQKVLRTTPEHREKQRRYKKKNKERFRDRQKDYDLRTNYGITLEDYNLMLENQNHRCKICESDTPAGKGWNVDHCHTTKKVRGVLCPHCNTGLGFFKDNPDLLIAAINYLNDSAET